MAISVIRSEIYKCHDCILPPLPLSLSIDELSTRITHITVVHVTLYYT